MTENGKLSLTDCDLQMNEQLIHIREVDTAAQIKTLRVLFNEYARSLHFDLSFQDFDKELSSLPGKYAAPDGCAILAYSADSVAGCVALRKIDSDICEMKRLYVRSAFHGQGIGRLLVAHIIEAARTRSYQKMRLDTVPSMQSAIALYRKFGFAEIDSYTANPIDGAIFLELDLGSSEPHCTMRS